MGRRIEQQAIAEELGVSVYLVSRVVRGRSLNRDAGQLVAARIAKLLDRPLEIVFPELA